MCAQNGNTSQQGSRFSFSKNAKDVLRRKIRDYISQLISDSIKLSKRERADTVSAIHVEQASSNMKYYPTKRFFRHLGILGGIPLGACLSTLMTMISSDRYSAAAVFISAVLGIIGAFMVALHIAKDS